MCYPNLEIPESRVATLLASYESSPARKALPKGIGQLGFAFAPLFVGFAQFIHQICQRAQIRRIFFQTSEGVLFRAVFDAWQNIAVAPELRITTDILYASRRSTFGAAASIDLRQAVDRLLSHYGSISSITLLDCLGIDRDEASTILKELAIDSSTRIQNPAADSLSHRIISKLSNTPAIVRALTSARHALSEYVNSIGLIDKKDIAIVDIGWRGTIIDNFAILFPNHHWAGIFVGLQPFQYQQPNNVTKQAWLVDQNREPGTGYDILRNFRVIEMLTMSNKGSVKAYECINGEWSPTLSTHTDNTAFFREFILPFQQGIIDSTPIVWQWATRNNISHDDFCSIGRNLIWSLLWNPPYLLANAYLSYQHDESFGLGRTIAPRRRIRVLSGLAALVSRRYRRKLKFQLEDDGWPQGALKCSLLGIPYLYARRTGTLWRL